MYYELINPSDEITFEAPTYEAAVCATLMVGKGMYSANHIDEHGDRKLFESALDKIDDPVKRKEFLAEWDDRKRSSMSQITNCAYAIAASFEEKERAERT